MRINGTKRKNHPATRKRRKPKIRLDIPGRKIETVEHTQQVGATGTALVVAAGLKGDDVLELSRRLVKVNHVYVPEPRNREVYERNDRVFKKLCKANAKIFRELNA